VGTIQFGDCGAECASGNTGTQLAALTFSSTGYPDYPWSPGPSWVPNSDFLEAYAPGDQIPGFLLAALAPEHISGLIVSQDGGTTSDWSAENPMTASRALDLNVGWTPAVVTATLQDGGAPAPPQMRLAMALQDGTGNAEGYLFCLVPDTNGTLTVPASLLQNFSAGDTCQDCYMARVSEAQDGQGNALHVQTAVAPEPEGGYATYQTTFQ
jgi:hypothetical protein